MDDLTLLMDGRMDGWTGRMSELTLQMGERMHGWTGRMDELTLRRTDFANGRTALANGRANTQTSKLSRIAKRADALAVDQSSHLYLWPCAKQLKLMTDAFHD